MITVLRLAPKGFHSNNAKQSKCDKGHQTLTNIAENPGIYLHEQHVLSCTIPYTRKVFTSTNFRHFF